MKKIAVVGSFNVDLIMQVARIPQPGETIGEGKFAKVFGGKGANQCLAAARAGAEVAFVACLGDDDFGKGGIASFDREGIDTTCMKLVDGDDTGTALIFVGADGENSIAVAPGANYKLTKEYIDAAEPVLKAADLIVMQLEVPMSTVQYVVSKSEQWGTKVLLNPAPAQALDKALLQALDILVVNETEAELISGERINSDADIKAIGNTLRSQGPETVILTLGSKGVYIISDDFEGAVAGHTVKAVDSTAAGDVFCGSLAAGLCSGKTLEQAVVFANAAAAISVTRLGAQTSAPFAEEIKAFIAEY